MLKLSVKRKVYIPLQRFLCGSVKLAMAHEELERLRAALEEARLYIDRAIELVSSLLGERVEELPPEWLIKRPVSYTHLTLPTKRIV